MRKFCILLLMFLILLSIAVCSNAEMAETELVNKNASQVVFSSLQDGKYTAYASDKDTIALMGWRDYMIINVEGGAITDIQIDSLNSTGDLKSQISKSQYPMTPHPSEWLPELIKQATEAAKGEDIDGITGATISSNAVRNMFDALLEAAASGNTQAIQTK
ncbi:MAG: FMN-binding protein [Christensenellales bacterium]